MTQAEKASIEFVIEELARMHKECDGMIERLCNDFIGRCSSREQLDNIQGTMMTIFDMIRLLVGIKETELEAQLREADK